MPKLSDLNPGKARKVLLVGEPGTGKTVCAASFEGPIYIFDFDGKVSSAAAYYAGDATRLAQIEYDSYVKNEGDLRPIHAFEKKLREFEVAAGAGTFPYRTVVLDSFTTFVDAMMKEILLANPAIQRTRSPTTVIPAQLDYRIQNIHVKQIVARLLALPCHVVVLAHVKTEKDELTGRIDRMPNAPGGLAIHLPVVFEEVYRTYVEVKGSERRFMAQTASDDFFPKARSQIRNLPAAIPLKFESIK